MPPPLHILILDDEKQITDNLDFFLRKKEIHTLCANLPSKAFEILRANPVDILICDIMLPEMNGLAVLSKVREEFPDIEVIMISGYGTMDTVIEALRSGAVDFIRKPFKMIDVELAIERTGKFIRLQSELGDAIRQNSLISRELEKMIERDFIGTSPAIQHVLDLALKAARNSDVNVLITGENGTGKEIIARIIHYASERKKKPFYPVNSSAIPDTLLESEFFGHKKGAFTGADEDRKGCFELASGGTLFLDEISDMPHILQAKLLRAIEEKKIKPVGGNKEVSVEVRIISATNKDIIKQIEKNNFRLDLFHRINTFEIYIPPLRERPEDIESLLHHFVKQIALRKNIPVQEICSNLVEALKHYHFPGNVRELKNMVERAMILANGDPLQNTHFFYQTHKTENHAPVENLNLTLEQLEINYIRDVLASTGNNKTKASRILGIPRYTLIRKMKKYKLG